MLVAPVAFQKLAHPEGEVAMARAAEAAGTVMCLSSDRDRGPTEVGAGCAGRKWMQLYCFRDRGDDPGAVGRGGRGRVRGACC